MDTGVRLRVGHQDTQFWPILVCFMDYYSLFWGPGVISTTEEPRGASLCRSSTLSFFVDSDPFHGLFLTVLGSQRDFHGCRTPRCAYVLVVKNRSLGRFWPISWTITQFWVPEVISTIDEPLGAFTCRSSALTILADSGLFRALLLTVLGTQSDFHD